MFKQLTKIDTLIKLYKKMYDPKEYFVFTQRLKIS